MDNQDDAYNPGGHTNIYSALAAAQSEFPTIPKNREGQTGNQRYKYANQADIMVAVQPSLGRHGLSLVQFYEPKDGDASRMWLITRLHHCLDQKTIVSRLPIPVGGQPKEMGVWMGYMRRYALEGILGVVASDEGDGMTSPISNGQNLGKRRPAFKKSPAGGTAQTENMFQSSMSETRIIDMMDELDEAEDFASLRTSYQRFYKEAQTAGDNEVKARLLRAFQSHPKYEKTQGKPNPKEDVK